MSCRGTNSVTEGRLQMRGGLKANLGRLETRPDCIELAKEQDAGERGLYTIQGQCTDHVG